LPRTRHPRARGVPALVVVAAAAVLLLSDRYPAELALVAVVVALLLQVYLNKGGKGCQVDEKRAVAQIPLDTITRTFAPTYKV